MQPRTVTVTRSSPAAVEEVWQLLADVSTWPSWAPVRRAAIERGSDHDLGVEGVGAVRVLTTALGATRERIVALEPPRHLAYELLSGLPVRNYRSDVRLEPAPGGGTTITWTSTFDSGAVWHRLVQLIVRSFAVALARAGAPARRPALRR